MKKKNLSYLSITSLGAASFLLTVFLGSIKILMLSYLLYVLTIVSTFYLLYILVDKDRNTRDTIDDLVSGNWHIVPMMIIFTVVMTTGFLIGMA